MGSGDNVPSRGLGTRCLRSKLDPAQRGESPIMDASQIPLYLQADAPVNGGAGIQINVYS